MVGKEILKIEPQAAEKPTQNSANIQGVQIMNVVFQGNTQEEIDDDIKELKYRE